MDRLTTLLLTVLCVLATFCHCTPIRVYEGTSGRQVYLPKAPKVKPIVPKPYREPAPVWEEPEPSYYIKKYIPYKPMKYGFVNPKTHRVFPSVDYNYNKRFIYGNYVHLNYV